MLVPTVTHLSGVKVEERPKVSLFGQSGRTEIPCGPKKLIKEYTVDKVETDLLSSAVGPVDNL